MAVISFVSSKGGVGKTTSAVVLAGELVAAGRKVALIDADPNKPLEAWSRLRPFPEKLRLIVDDSAETIIDTIEDARAEADFVIVDLEGTATDRIGFAIARSDLVLIRCKALFWMRPRQRSRSSWCVKCGKWQTAKSHIACSLRVCRPQSASERHAT